MLSELALFSSPNFPFNLKTHNYTYTFFDKYLWLMNLL